MALKHWGGAPPEPLVEWACPSCGAANTVPLKAGCQACGAGADAKKVVAAPPTAAVTQYPDWPATNRSVDTQNPLIVACQAWWASRRRGADDHFTAVVEEAFMAGVAWAQAQSAGGRDSSNPQEAEVVPEPYRDPSFRYTLLERDAMGEQELDGPTVRTILAALAFYRDNQLLYGPLPGQLTAEQVTALIQRLSPQESPA